MIKHFFISIASTVYNPVFYAKAQREGMNSPIKITAVLGGIGAIILMATLYVALIPFTNPPFLDKIAALYPDDLVITLAHGEVSINQPEPYYVKNTLDAKGPADLVIFDTGDTLKGGAAANGTYVLVKKDYAITDQGTGGERVASFAQMATTSTTSISKADVAGFIDKIRPYVRPAVLIGGLFAVVLGALVGAAFWLAFHLLYLLIPGILIYLYGRFRVPQMKWKDSYIVALYASIPVAIATYFLHFAGLAWPIFFYTLLVMLVALLNLAQAPSRVPKLPQQ